MSGSIRIGTIAGIGIFVHWTFWVFFIFLAFTFWGRSADPWQAIEALLFILAVFGCVVLHELGHALAARQFGVETRDITLLPIGGVARLERIPEEPLQELWIAAAGPLVNVAIAAVLYFVQPKAAGQLAAEGLLAPESFWNSLMRVNIFLVLFNLLPAFPMDGGRILRAALAMRMSHWRATEVAASVGKVMAVLFALAGLFGNFMLLFIALFVYLGAEGESQLARMNNLLAGIPVRDGMITDFSVLRPEDTLKTAIEMLLAGSQQDFPVVADGQLVGMLSRNRLFQALQQGGQEHLVAEYMEPVCLTVSPFDALDAVVRDMQQHHCPTVPVVWQDRLVGLVTNDNVVELVTLRNIFLSRQESVKTT
ncbi:MAG: protease [Pirellulaceae bacterium]|nr:MAG: protease [Pirellulaceae bacterium]